MLKTGYQIIDTVNPDIRRRILDNMEAQKKTSRLEDKYESFENFIETAFDWSATLEKAPFWINVKKTYINPEPSLTDRMRLP